MIERNVERAETGRARERLYIRDSGLERSVFKGLVEFISLYKGLAALPHYTFESALKSSV